MKPLHIFFSLIVSAIWGCNFVASKIAMEHFPPLLMSFLRFGGVTLVLLPFLRLPPRDKWWPLFWFSFTLGTLHFALVFTGMHLGLDVSTSIITTQMGVPFSVVLGAIFLKDYLGPWRSGGLAVAFLGIVLIAGSPQVAAHLGAFFFVFAGAFAWSVSNILIKQLGQIPIMSLLAWTALLSAPQLLALSLLFESGQWGYIISAPLVPSLGIAYSIFLSTIVAYTLWYRLLTWYDVSQVVPFSLMIPLFGVAASVLVLDERLTATMVLGSAITIVGVGIITVRRPKIVEEGNPA